MKLNLRQQRALAEVIDKAQRQGGEHRKRQRNGWVFTARPSENGLIRFAVTDAQDNLICRGECA